MCNASIALSPCCSNSSARLLISYRPYGERLPGLNSGLPSSCVTETDFDCFRTLTPMRSPASRFPPRSSGESQQKQVFPARSWAASGHQMVCYIRWYPDRLSPLSSLCLAPQSAQFRTPNPSRRPTQAERAAKMGKKVNGRKRQCWVDTNGFLLRVL